MRINLSKKVMESVEGSTKSRVNESTSKWRVDYEGSSESPHVLAQYYTKDVAMKKAKLLKRKHPDLKVFISKDDIMNDKVEYVLESVSSDLDTQLAELRFNLRITSIPGYVLVVKSDMMKEVVTLYLSNMYDRSVGVVLAYIDYGSLTDLLHNPSDIRLLSSQINERLKHFEIVLPGEPIRI